uniref:AIG1-type G domain-containing protein n=1 Tax=Neogobius melanostomus TaxID=47308 RepID=A0A8C6TYG0_9GOBI
MDRDFSRYISESVKLDDGPPARYQLRTKIINLDRLLDENSKLRKFTFGKRDHKHPNKTVLLVGATGSGKSTLINALVNFVMGVKFEDKVWFEIVTDKKNKSQSETQTTAVSVYEVFGFEGKTVPYSLTIIDTPGYGDTRGIEYDDIITKKLQDLFSIPDEVETIDVVGLVLKATENRLDERTAYIFNSVTSLFGRDMEQKIVALITHSDGMKPKDALQALDEAKVKCARKENNEPVYFLFNNRQKEKLEEGSDDEATQSADKI